MKAPASQFYWKDWVDDLALASCSWAAQGVWVRVLAKLHQSEEYGVLRWPLKEVARAAGVPIKYLHELAQKNVLKGGDTYDADLWHTPTHQGKRLEPVRVLEANGGSCWFSSRMVRDHWRQGRRGAATRFTADNQPSRTPTRRVGERLGDGPASASASAFDSSISTESCKASTGAEDLARALRESGYSECSAHVPDLLEAQAAGITGEEIRAVAEANRGKAKPIAYLVATAIGKRNDRSERAQGRPASAIAAVQSIDPVKAARRDELHRLDSERLLAESDARLGLITPERLAERLADLQSQRQQAMEAQS